MDNERTKEFEREPEDTVTAAEQETAAVYASCPEKTPACGLGRRACGFISMLRKRISFPSSFSESGKRRARGRKQRRRS